MQEILERIVKTPKNYTIVMFIVFVFLLIFNLIYKSYFGFACVGFILGLWLGFVMRWIFIK